MMVFDLQKAGFWKRFGAFLLDAILAIVLITGIAVLLSWALGWDDTISEYKSYQDAFAKEYGVDFSVDPDSYTGEDKDFYTEQYTKAYNALHQSREAAEVGNQMVVTALAILTLSILLSITVLEFVVPLLLKNGQTLGKKIFSICVMHSNGVKISTRGLFARSLLGKFTLETMIPVLLFVLGLLNGNLITFLVFTGLLFLLQAVLYFVTQTNSVVHDVIAYTVVVDFTSQQIFENQDEMLAYQKKQAAEQAQRERY